MNAAVELPDSARCSSAKAIIAANCGAITRPMTNTTTHSHAPGPATTTNDHGRQDQQRQRGGEHLRRRDPPGDVDGRDPAADEARPERRRHTRGRARAAVADLLDVGVDPAGDAALDADVDHEEQADRHDLARSAPAGRRGGWRARHACGAAPDGRGARTTQNAPSRPSGTTSGHSSPDQASARLTASGASSAPTAKHRCRPWSSGPDPSGRAHRTKRVAGGVARAEHEAEHDEHADHQRQRREDRHGGDPGQR